MQDSLESILALTPVLPVVTIERIEDAVPLASALLRGGIGTLEVTLRTAAALDAIRAISAEVPDVVVGAGTVLTALDMDSALAAGARFLVSPGSTQTLIDTALERRAALLPGAATASEAMSLLEQGFHYQKFFPAEAAGGIALLKSLAGPLPQLRFCPTGGITAAKAPDYLALPNVICVGGSWLTPESLVAAGDWSAIEERARQTLALRKAPPA